MTTHGILPSNGYSKLSSNADTTHLDYEEVHALVDGQFISHIAGEVSEMGLNETGLSSYTN